LTSKIQLLLNYLTIDHRPQVSHQLNPALLNIAYMHVLGLLPLQCYLFTHTICLPIS